ncbi:ribonuclease P protein component [Methylobacterium sp. 77]|uniref:ribonuclease P protein component n=1 Tax=Methylobacterium sp. 77 TaxID=1101192 RepID=UPI00036991DE|nr:ribonuclease P protein component [Methylobacterium sp. 77]
MTSPLGRRIEPAVSTIGRLKRRPDFLAAAGGRRFHTEHMSAQGRLRNAAGISVPASTDEAAIEGLRIGFTITKRVGHATERNRIRRRLRDAVQRASADLPAAAADVVLVARRPALHAPFETLVTDLRRSIGAVIKPGDGKPRDGRPGGQNRPGRGKGRGNTADAGKASASARTYKSSDSQSSPHAAEAPAQHEAPPVPRAASGAFSPSPPSNTRDGSLDG